MAIFRKKTRTQDLAAELAGLRQRATALETKRQAADAELTAATEARQRHHIEGDLDDTNAAQKLQDRVNGAASQIVGLEDALAVVQAQIAEIEGKLEAARTRAERAAAADKMARDLDEFEAALPEYMRQARRIVDAAEAFGHFHYEAGELGTIVRTWAAQIELAGALAVQELRAMTIAIREGSAAIPADKPQPAPRIAAIEPTPETLRLFAVHSVKWRDPVDGRQRFGAQYEDHDLPYAAAARGLRCGALVGLDHPERARLHGVKGGRVDTSAIDVVDLDLIEEHRGISYVGPSDPQAEPRKERGTVRIDPVSGVTFEEFDRGPARIAMTEGPRV